MSLVLITWGGSIKTGSTVTDPSIEEWSNSMACIGASSPDLNALDAVVAPALDTWFTAGATKIHTTVWLEWLKINVWDVATGHQITDPTHEHIYPSGGHHGGYGGETAPTSVSYKVSIDNGTRNRRARGGFFVPRTSMHVGGDGRWDSAELAGALGTVQTFMAACQTAPLTVGVWSRVDKSVTAATRVRLGNVPDNISRRRNKLREVYVEASI